MHGPDCTDVISGLLVFIQTIHYVDWVKAVDQRTGLANQDYIAFPFAGVLADPSDHSTRPFEATLLIKPDGAAAIVRGVADLLDGPPPPEMQIPGSN